LRNASAIFPACCGDNPPFTLAACGNRPPRQASNTTASLKLTDRNGREQLITP
jgi:hypothetical protein